MGIQRALHCKPTQKHPRPFYYIVGAGLGSARPCRTLALAFRPAPTPNTLALAVSATPQYAPAPLEGLQCRPLQAKGKAHTKTPPPLPHPQPRKYTPAPLEGLQCRPLQAKGKPRAKTPPPFLLYSRGEHCSPAKALCCRKAPRVEQSPTPTINRKRMREIFIAIL